MLTKCVAIFVIVMVLGGLACAVAFAAVSDNSPVTFDLKDADVRSVIDVMLKGRNYTVAQDVSGIIPSV